LNGDSDRAVGIEFLAVSQMGLADKDRAGAFRIIGLVETNEFEGLINRALKQNIIIGHIEMAIPVDPVRLDPQNG